MRRLSLWRQQWDSSVCIGTWGPPVWAERWGICLPFILARCHTNTMGAGAKSLNGPAHVPIQTIGPGSVILLLLRPSFWWCARLLRLPQPHFDLEGKRHRQTATHEYKACCGLCVTVPHMQKLIFTGR